MSLTEYVAARANEGMYNMVAGVERKVRTDMNVIKVDLEKKYLVMPMMK
jgi:hypothetical protein